MLPTHMLTPTPPDLNLLEDHISLSTTPLHVGEIYCFTVVLLVGQRAPCGVTEKLFCKKTKQNSNSYKNMGPSLKLTVAHVNQE